MLNKVAEQSELKNMHRISLESKYKDIDGVIAVTEDLKVLVTDEMYCGMLDYQISTGKSELEAIDFLEQIGVKTTPL